MNNFIMNKNILPRFYYFVSKERTKLFFDRIYLKEIANIRFNYNFLEKYGITSDLKGHKTNVFYNGFAKAELERLFLNKKPFLLSLMFNFLFSAIPFFRFLFGVIILILFFMGFYLFFFPKMEYIFFFF